MKIKENIIMILEKVGFYLSNVIILVFLISAFREQSLERVLTLGLALLGLIGGLSALCYSGVSSQKDEIEAKIYKVSADRFLHSFITLAMGVIFSGALIHVTKNGLFQVKNKIFIGVVSSVLLIFAVVYLVKAARSFSIGFHMIISILNEKFKLRDEKLFNDLDKE